MPKFDQSLPLPTPQSSPSDDLPEEKPQTKAALDLIRNKVSSIYAKEPSALQEEQEIIATGAHSKHQKYIKKLMDSGQDLATIQTEWHSYYQSLPDTEKHQVWNEFYSAYDKSKKASQATSSVLPASKQLAPLSSPRMSRRRSLKPRSSLNKKSMETAKTELLDKVTARGKLSPKHHLQSLLFGLSMGMIVVAVVMLSFFNERFIAPFITPSRTASASPIIINPNEQVGPESKVIIPKINVDVPVVYDMTTNEEKAVQAALENGVVHYPSTPVPGQNGNVVIVGHSSNNLLNRGKYKFAFVLLNKLQEGDTITMQYGGKRYVYKVYEKVIVKPSDVGVLGPTDKTASLSLITCDPPGTSINRLVVRAEQISPNPNGNVAASTANQVANTPDIVPGNAPSLFERLFGWL
ncbi:class D sortase [Candidatus Saccharibacteria bacterium]|nr:class D sortase [Candidatus Saccharibacteria bacterium]MCB9817074.1 class D sortase [Candidatus Nomurabacteria bacterium]